MVIDPASPQLVFELGIQDHFAIALKCTTAPSPSSEQSIRRSSVPIVQEVLCQISTTKPFFNNHFESKDLHQATARTKN